MSSSELLGWGGVVWGKLSTGSLGAMWVLSLWLWGTARLSWGSGLSLQACPLMWPVAIFPLPQLSVPLVIGSGKAFGLCGLC